MPPHLKHVATLPCDISTFKKLPCSILMFAYVHAAAQTSNVWKFHTIFDGQFFFATDRNMCYSNVWVLRGVIPLIQRSILHLDIPSHSAYSESTRRTAPGVRVKVRRTRQVLPQRQSEGPSSRSVDIPVAKCINLHDLPGQVTFPNFFRHSIHFDDYFRFSKSTSVTGTNFVQIA